MIERSQEFGEIEAPAQTLALTVADDDAGRRLDVQLAGAFADLSRTRLKSLIVAGRVRVGGRTIVEPKYRVNAGDRIEIALPPPEAAAPAAEAIALDIVYEDEALIVVDKPAGLVVHPGAGNPAGTLVNALIAHCGDSLSGIGGVRRPGIVHRLDKDTSGLIVAAKTDRAHKALAAQFADHGRAGALDRAYTALVWSAPPRLSGTIDAPLARSGTNRLKQAVSRAASARRAVTHYRVRERFGADGKSSTDAVAASVECRLETGRTHQIRVHLAHIGCPLIGDPTYGAHFRSKLARLAQDHPEIAAVLADLGRQALHAHRLGFAHPLTKEVLTFESPLPGDMKAVIAALRRL